MKKILCFTIALIMLLGAVSVSAVTEEGNIYSNEFYQPRFQKCWDRMTEWDSYATEMPYTTYKEQYVHYSEEASTDEATPDYVVIAPTPVGGGQPAFFIRMTGDYVFFDYQYTDPAAPCIYVYVSSTDEVLHIREAYEKYPEEMVPGLNAMTQVEHPRVGRSGDADFNGRLDIKDATLLQKVLAGLESEFECPERKDVNELLYRAVLDFDRDGKINVIDVTSIQKCLAGLPFFVDDGNYYLW